MFRAVFAARTWRETAYLLLDLPIGIVGFTLVVTGISFGLSLLLTFVGIPILGLTLLTCRTWAAGEVRRARMIGLRLPTPPPLSREGSFFRRWARPLADAAG